ncbi:MAG: phosphoribosylformylglycinamidine synthase subunit PurL [Sumerlaeia bacterium]
MSEPSPPMTPELIAQHGFTPSEYETLKQRLGREPNLTELGVFSVMWSEHCSYKHSRPLLMTLPTRGERVLHGPGENAGAIDIGGGWACIFKIESHNHPSAVEPYQGAATGVGGILRDIFAMGARPIALFDALRFGPMTEGRNRHLAKGVVNGIADYGNCVGVPTVGGEFSVDPAYTDNCLVNVMCVGVARHEEIMTAKAKGAGDMLVYYGNATGRDGVHGATFASTELTEETAEQRSSVQVGDPYMEKKILEATLELIASGAIVALQDMGAAGLTCSSTEMADKAGLGLRMDLDFIPQRAANLSAYEMLLSESQERMLAVVKEEDLPQVTDILKKWDLEAIVCGQTTDTGRFVVERETNVVCDVPLASICSDVPPPEPVEPRPAYPATKDGVALAEASCGDYNEVLKTTLAHPNFARKSWIWEQYDHHVGTSTIVGPGLTAAVMRVRGWDEGLLAATVDGNGLWCHLDPYEGTKCVVAEAARNLVCCGARPLAVTNNLNFGSPRKGAGAWQLAESVKGLGEACRAFGTPVTGGNVSLYNESPRTAVFPTPVIGMVGVVEGGGKHLKFSHFTRPGDVILLLGPAATHCGGSRILRDRTGELPGPGLKIDMDFELKLQALLLDLIGEGLADAALDISEGGLLMALAEMALCTKDAALRGRGHEIGCRVQLPFDEPSAHVSLLSEEPSRVVITCSEQSVPSLLAACEQKGVRALQIGVTAKETFEIQGCLKTTVADMRDAWMTEP